MPLYVLITIDTESFRHGRPDLQIWGRADDGQEYGIRRIMSALERRGMRGTFYVNVFEAEKHGVPAIAAVIDAIRQRGHEVGLHTHPRVRYGVEKMSRADRARQVEILRWGKDFIERETGEPVLAHRAGAFAANRDTLGALAEVGIAVDASLSPAWPESQLAREVESGNRPSILDGVLELPVTYYVQARLGTRRLLRMVDIEASSLAELKSVVRQAVVQRAGAINLLMHSHTFVREGRPRHDLLRRLEAFLEFLQAAEGVQVATTRGFYEHWMRSSSPALPDSAAAEQRPFEPYTGWWMAGVRTIQSGVAEMARTTAAATAKLGDYRLSSARQAQRQGAGYEADDDAPADRI